MTEDTRNNYVQHPTFGEYTVRLSFNPSAKSEVEIMKKQVANCIDYLRTVGLDPRMTATAITHLQTASMYAVGSITSEPVPDHLR